MTKDQIAEIKELLKQLKIKCLIAKCPLVSVIQYKASENKEHRIKTVLTPQAVDYDGDTKVFYEVMNVLNGNFRTVLAKEIPDDNAENDDKFFG